MKMTLEELFRNKDLILAKKMNEKQYSDAVVYVHNENESTSKEEITNKEYDDKELDGLDSIQCSLVINSSGFIDSHRDCHIKGNFTKSVRENKVFFLVNSHRMDFENVIVDSISGNLKASIKDISIKALGYKAEGTTDCLVFDATIEKKRNKFMFEQYAKGYVLQHSVGMRYIKIALCVNSDELQWKEEKKSWDKYYGQVINKEVADEIGYFYAILEAKFIEGSAVVRASNPYTPVTEIEVKENNEPPIGTHKNEPPIGTQPKVSINSFKF